MRGRDKVYEVTRRGEISLHRNSSSETAGKKIRIIKAIEKVISLRLYMNRIKS